jgi:hypothetical protein
MDRCVLVYWFFNKIHLTIYKIIYYTIFNRKA